MKLSFHLKRMLDGGLVYWFSQTCNEVYLIEKIFLNSVLSSENTVITGAVYIWD